MKFLQNIPKYNFLVDQLYKFTDHDLAISDWQTIFFLVKPRDIQEVDGVWSQIVFLRLNLLGNKTVWIWWRRKKRNHAKRSLAWGEGKWSIFSGFRILCDQLIATPWSCEGRHKVLLRLIKFSHLFRCQLNTSPVLCTMKINHSRGFSLWNWRERDVIEWQKNPRHVLYKSVARDHGIDLENFQLSTDGFLHLTPCHSHSQSFVKKNININDNAKINELLIFSSQPRIFLCHTKLMIICFKLFFSLQNTIKDFSETLRKLATFLVSGFNLLKRTFFFFGSTEGISDAKVAVLLRLIPVISSKN